VATLTLVFDSSSGLPSGKLYAEEVDGLRRAGRRIVEISKLAVDRELGARGMAVLKGLFRLGWLTSARVRDATDFVIMVEPHHERFYVRNMLFERIGEEKPDPEAEGAPSLLLRLNLETAEGRYRETFGDRKGPSNAYRFFCLDPEVAETEDRARAADGRLSGMNRRVETGRELPDPTPAEQRYADYRLFSIAFVTDKTCREAERRARKGLFRAEIEAYAKLLAALPPDYAPEQRARIYTDIADAAWHCGMYERALALAGIARRLAEGVGLKAAGCRIAAAALHFLGRGEEALAEIREGLTLPDIPAIERGRLLQLDGRMAVDRFDLPAARESLLGAREAGEGLPRTPETDRFLAATLHNLWLVDSNRGDLTAAGEALRAGGQYLTDAGGTLLGQYHSAWCHMETYLGRPRESLAHAEMGLRQIDPVSSPYNAVILVRARGNAHLAMGDLDAAWDDSREETELAARSRFPSLIFYATCQRAVLLAAEDRLDEARREMESGPASGEELSPLGEVNRLHALAQLSALEGDWEKARELREKLAERAEQVPLYKALSRRERVQVELQAGDLPAARRLAGGMAEPEDLPGFAGYRASWMSTRAVLTAADGDGERAVSLAEGSLAAFRAGEALRDLAEHALVTVEALRNCGLGSDHPELRALLIDEAKAVCESARLPGCIRRLAELSRQGTGPGSSRLGTPATS
jgi:tetratricopeptide (TPR) repeat protein